MGFCRRTLESVVMANLSVTAHFQLRMRNSSGTMRAPYTSCFNTRTTKYLERLHRPLSLPTKPSRTDGRGAFSLFHLN